MGTVARNQLGSQRKKSEGIITYIIRHKLQGHLVDARGTMRSLSLLLLVTACTSVQRSDNGQISGPRAPTNPASVASGLLEANWKERLEQAYVFLDVRGDYRRVAGAMQGLRAAADSLGLRGDGAPFALFFDDPGKVPLDELRARVCFPVGERPERLGALQYDLLPRAMVVYTRVQGAHDSVAPAYPALFAYLRELGWRQGGPVREVYLASPAGAELEELLTEVQIPWAIRSE